MNIETIQYKFKIGDEVVVQLKEFNPFESPKSYMSTIKQIVICEDNFFKNHILLQSKFEENKILEKDIETIVMA
ncbi:MAG: hypothetical protein LBM96_05890 [Methanobrevibacter sp.]|jgi:hypothetical protein|nr:hypothetical protein [Candidatus Methanoflexus mossambicus]